MSSEKRQPRRKKSRRPQGPSSSSSAVTLSSRGSRRSGAGAGNTSGGCCNRCAALSRFLTSRGETTAPKFTFRRIARDGSRGIEAASCGVWRMKRACTCSWRWTAGARNASSYSAAKLVRRRVRPAAWLLNASSTNSCRKSSVTMGTMAARAADRTPGRARRRAGARTPAAAPRRRGAEEAAGTIPGDVADSGAMGKSRGGRSVATVCFFCECCRRKTLTPHVHHQCVWG
mmetsp:Transcript_26738/g.74690  ORF Transcript_26738/g.74690 Transcript_26738/m.74690 type:complete len:230 (-) Transcript_26738:2-691(-)